MFYLRIDEMMVALWLFKYKTNFHRSYLSALGSIVVFEKNYNKSYSLLGFYKEFRNK